MSSASKRLDKIKHHLQPNDNPHFESLRIHRKPGQTPHMTKLDPLSFLLRTTMIHPHKTAIIHRQRTFTYLEFCDRVKALATVLIERYKVSNGDRVGILCQNINPFIEAQYAVPAIGAIIVPMNTRLAAKEIEYMIEHSGASVLIVQQALMNKLTEKSKSQATLIVVADSDDPSVDPYEQLLATSSNSISWNDMPSLDDENETLSINYTSGSTGKPKGVMITYRGAYMVTLALISQCKLSNNAVFLWTLPMFHCNGWGFPWAIVAVGGTQVMLNTLDYTYIWKLLKEHGVTHYSGAPTIQSEICKHKDAVRLNHSVQTYCGGSPLTGVLIKRMKNLNLIPNQVYGLTETCGPAVISCDISTLSDYTEEEQIKILARPGFNVVTTNEVRVLNIDTAKDVKPDGKEVGEVCFTGNLLMKGYYKNPEETEKAFRHGVYWSGDLAARHPDGSIEIFDRSKDVIVSGGENISSLEVESVITQLKEVSECTVVAGPDNKWGERPVAFVVVEKNRKLNAEDVIKHCRDSLAGYKCPSKVLFIDSLPKTSTGKTQKYTLREQLWKNYTKRVN